MAQSRSELMNQKGSAESATMKRVQSVGLMSLIGKKRANVRTMAAALRSSLGTALLKYLGAP